MLRVSRPSDAVVLNCWVTDTKVAPHRSSTSMIRAKSSRDRVSRSTLYTTTQFTVPDSMSASNRFNAGRSMLAPV